MQVKLIWITHNPEATIAKCARVSSDNPDNPEYERLITYCIKNKHWSIFEQAAMCVEIHTTRAITAQILRHRSFSFEELSSRYKEIDKPEVFEIRKQGETNRQGGEELLSECENEYWQKEIDKCMAQNYSLYQRLLKGGIARECARMVLPLSSPSKIYMTGTIRSWIHYLEIRTDSHAQKEHREIANKIKNELFIPNLHTISKALQWI